MPLFSSFLSAASGSALIVSSGLTGLAEIDDEIRLYEAAIADLEAQLAAEATPGVCDFVFQRIADDAPVFRYSGDENAGAWRDGDDAPVDLEQVPLPEDGAAMIALRLSMFDSSQGTHFLRDEDGIAVFAVTSEEFSVNGMGQEVNIAEHLAGEVGVDRATGRLNHVRYYAPESFKPAPIARFRMFDHRVDVAPAWEDGPLVRTRTRTQMTVSAMFQTHELDDQLRFSEFGACE